jgi:hypothetical protein
MQLVRLRLTGKQHAPRDLLPTRKNVAENNKYVEKETPRASKFIGDSSPISTMLQPLRGKGTSREGAGPLPAACFRAPGGKRRESMAMT